MSKTILPNNLSRSVLVWDHEDPEKIKTREVKNLGWLLRHWTDVESLEVSRPPEFLTSHWDCVFKANLRPSCGPTYYATTFSSLSVLWNWLDRPVFFGAKLSWFGASLTIYKGQSKNPAYPAKAS